MMGDKMHRWVLALPFLLCAAGPDVPRPVRVTTVVMAPIASDMIFSGTVQARIQADLGFRVSGKIISRLVEVGDQVRAGQVLARLDDSDLALTEQADDAAVQSAIADAADARTELGRYEKLGRSSAAYLPSEYDRRLAASRMADARLVQTQRQRDLAHSQRLYGALVADADGVVTAVHAQVGQVVAAGQTVFTLAHSDDVEVVADVPENRLAAVRGAGEVGIALWAAPDRVLYGKMREIGALADPATRTFAVKVHLIDAPPGLLGLGMTASVRFGQPTPPLARLPATALTDQDGKPAVWVLDTAKGHASLRPVQVAAYAADGSVLVAGGVSNGEQVVTAGVGQIAPDMALVAWTGAAR
jgi:RND family efflux transporter MFP subunit